MVGVQKNDWDSGLENKSLRRKKILKRVAQFFFICFVVFLVVTVGSIGVGAGLVSALTKDEKIRDKDDFDKDLQGWSQTSYAYFRSPDGKQSPQRIGSLITANDRQLIHSLDEVSPYLIDAFLAVEDREFYKHNGIVPTAILRATYQQVSGSDITTGGSTITQQLVKSEVLDDRDKTYERKAKEIINAIRIEKYYNKEEIFVAYLNSAYFGKGAHHKHMYGVAAAARGIFNKPLKELELAQAAYIAGMVQRPNAYNPINNDEKLKLGLERMELVLKIMLQEKKITQQQFDEAMKFDIKGSLAKSSDFRNGYEEYPFIISAVEREAIEILREQDKAKKLKPKTDEQYRDDVVNGGFHIYTTIDKNIYDAMNKSLNGLHIPKKKIKGQMRSEQVGAVLIENKTGAVLSFYAGTNFNQNQKDHAFDAKNQPGSTIKPLLVYGPAINEGIISPNSTIIDEPIPKADGSGYYRNANGDYKGPVSATTALQYSYNIPAVKIFNAMGHERGFNYLRKMNLPPHKWDGEAAALGGVRNGYTVADMTAAYAAIGNQGVYNKPYIIEKIVDSQGNEVYNYHKVNKPKQIFTPQTTYHLTQMMRKVVTSGTAQSIGSRFSGYNIAGKTGTTSNKWDLWFIGYTPEVSLGVWSGYDYNATGSEQLAKNAWIRFFRAAAKTDPNLIPRGSQFPNPGGSIPDQCFECHRQAPPPSPDDKPQHGQPGQREPAQPTQPGQPPAQPPISQPGPPSQPDPGNGEGEDRDGDNRGSDGDNG